MVKFKKKKMSLETQYTIALSSILFLLAAISIYGAFFTNWF